jgi:MoaA/NifB/PqqE/SkfB family radical SAM enzyme
MTDRYYKQELLRRLQFFKDHLKTVDESNPTASGRGVKLIEDVIKYIQEN